MTLAIFDLDNTLLADDSDYLWGLFLADQGIVDRDYYLRENERFFQEYKEGRLDIYEFLRFSLKPLSEHPLDYLYALRERFLLERIEPLLLPASSALLQKHREVGDILIIITATNSFVTAPIAERLRVDYLIATEPEMSDGRYTGKVAGEPAYREGKVKRLNAWLGAHHQDLKGSSFYTDSHNDIPLLELVDNPVAVDPDSLLAEYAGSRNWPLISLRG